MTKTFLWKIWSVYNHPTTIGREGVSAKKPLTFLRVELLKKIYQVLYTIDMSFRYLIPTKIASASRVDGWGTTQRPQNGN